MKTIWKYTLDVKEKQEIEVPFGSEILSAEDQKGNIVIYFLVDPKENDIFAVYEVLVYGTGHEITEDISSYKFLNTVKM